MLTKDLLCLFVRQSSYSTRLCSLSNICRTASTYCGPQAPSAYVIKSNHTQNSWAHPLNTNTSGLSFQQIRFKGHAHWQNVKGIKAANNKKKSFLLESFRMKVLTALKADGPDLKTNSELSKLIKECQVNNIEKAYVLRWIDSFVNKVQDEPFYFELLGPKGTIFVLKMMSNTDICRQEVNKFIRKTGLNHPKAPGWRNSFEEKGLVSVPVDESMDVTQMDNYIEIAIESGAEDVIVTENDVGAPDVSTVLKFHCEPRSVDKVAMEIQNNFDLKVYSNGVHLLPYSFVTMETEDELNFYKNVYEKTHVFENLIQIYDNVTVPED